MRTAKPAIRSGAEEKRLQILRAAERLFATRRFHELTLDEVARAAKVGKGTIYLHFAGKDDLFVETAANGFEELCRQLGGLLDAAPEPELLLEGARRMGRFFEQRHRTMRLMEGEGHRLFHGGLGARLAAHRKRMLELLAGLMERLQAGGVIGAAEPPAVQARFLLALLHARQHAACEAGAATATVEDVVAFFRRGTGVAAA